MSGDSHLLNRAIYARLGVADHESAESLRSAWLSIPALRLAYALWMRGYSVIPLLPHTKQPAVRWKRYQSEICTVEELIAWFVTDDFAPGVVTGEVSGITIVDCDDSAAAEYWQTTGEAWFASQRTPRGRHFVQLWAGERNTVKMHGVDGLDRRGDGGYVKAYPDAATWPPASLSRSK